MMNYRKKCGTRQRMSVQLQMKNKITVMRMDIQILLTY